MKLSNKEESNIIESVDQAFKGLAEAAKSLDVGQYSEFFDKAKFTALNADGTVTHSFEEFENTYREQISFLERYQSLEFSNVKISIINLQTAILVNEFSAEVKLKSGEIISAKGAGTQVWSETDGEWKLVSVSSSSQN
jgi:ketosteroid isomerase-like protein